MIPFMNFLLVILAVLPLLVADSAFFPYISGKSLLARFSIALVAILFFVCLINKKSFKGQIRAKIRVLIKNPIFFSVLAHFLIFVFSAFFAVNRFWAFFGSVERGEGVVGVLFFFGFFIFSLLLFQKKEWFDFFKLSLVVSVILFVHAVMQALAGVDRPGSFTGQYTYLAAYFIFIIFIALILYFSESPKGEFWKIVSVAMMPISFLGILITKTRGALVGLAAGFFVTLVYLAIFGRETTWRGFRVRKASLAFLVVLVLFSGTFFATRQSVFWQQIPGFNRLAQISLKDKTTQSRILTAKVSLRSVDPRENNMGRLLVGWGPENFSIAWNQFYDPRIYLNDPTTLDRAHNKVLDTLVMNGIFGLLSYLAIWFFVFKSLFAKGDPIAYRSALIFFGVSYFVQNLFVFDSVTTYIPFLAFLSFLIFLQGNEKI